MTTAGSGAVFFLGTRAHYQVLQQPESRFDAENGNSTESIYQNPAVDSPDKSTCNIGERNLAYIDSEANNVTEDDPKETNAVIKRRPSRRPSEQILCDDRDSDMKPALLNHLGDSETPKKPSRRRINLLAFLASLVPRKRHLDADSIQYLQHIETALTSCTYRESCRCLHCQIVAKEASNAFKVPSIPFRHDKLDNVKAALLFVTYRFIMVLFYNI